MATGFESYTVEIDDSGDWDGDTLVSGGRPGMRVHMVAEIGDCCLSPGDPSPIGRCPETGDLVYLDRPIDRARDAAPDLLASLRAILPYAESRAEDMADCADALAEDAENFDIDDKAGLAKIRDRRDESRAYADKAVAAVDTAKALLASLDGSTDAESAADA